MGKVVIYGKEGCPYTAAALKDYEERGFECDYRDVKADAKALEEMLAKSGGQRVVPVIIEGDEIKIGFGGT